ncbi:SMI1/KNR4 family protein [Cellulophaga sp. BC115SP]|uniref:SMI1/KNR4 family protein n=1 Tax=Cellulophaga sp. BC115SP TaxID=2683263 RepID=UPI001412D34E|nr:SMI1/KNR4 family protein [Cellulophaga sp. BC115SP]NBB31433.1 hypothetical protein [Cellulophaga sp. BC115SP]
MKYLSELPLWFLNHPKNVGCTEDEIKEMESFYGFKFPEAYCEYLAFMGETSYYMNVHAYTSGLAYLNYEYMRTYAKWVLDMYNEDYGTKTAFDDNFIIFAMHDESFLFMKSNEGENPPVYVFNADGPGSEVRRCDNSFIECIIAHITRKDT